MKINRINLSKSKMPLILTAFLITIFAMSCSKSSDDVTNANFTGIYSGTLTNGSYSEADTITIPASNSAAIVMNSKTGIGSTYTINGNISGSALSIPSQPVYISGLGSTYTVTGDGTLTNSTLAINYVFVTSANVTSHWTFTGTRN